MNRKVISKVKETDVYKSVEQAGAGTDVLNSDHECYSTIHRDN